VRFFVRRFRSMLYRWLKLVLLPSHGRREQERYPCWYLIQWVKKALAVVPPLLDSLKAS
jgi:hypothetical protein